MNADKQVIELIKFARQHSRYFDHHFRALPDPVENLAILPLINPSDYWKESDHLEHWPVLTGALEHAVVFKTGGTTSSGKLSVFTQPEWQRLVKDFGSSCTSRFNQGDRVANLFFAGDLYASFVFIHDSLAHVGVGITEFPFTGAVEHGELAGAILRHRINVLAGVPAHLLKFADWLASRTMTLDVVDTVLYGGESLFAAQRALLHRVMPNARIASIGYASVDAGFIGGSHRDCDDGEHRMNEQHTLVEIIDEHTGEIIEGCDHTGLLIVTNLTRRLMPLIRYPVGDRACWREPVGTPGRKFALQGRSASARRLRVVSATLFPEEMAEIILRTVGADDWQLLIELRDQKTVLTLKWAHVAVPSSLNLTLRTALLERYPELAELITDGQLDLLIRGCTVDDLSLHPRSGKRQRVVDLRFHDVPTMEASPWTR
ncbi:phenylacetate--CoA ligase family protein [Pseudomonas syringae]|nr:phenylacetate--CoA ligase family protein [Pseudomonas syringae]MCF5069533.1 phenylacetate--CoA ligase family protein [Pseudomonas syringae]